MGATEQNSTGVSRRKGQQSLPGLTTARPETRAQEMKAGEEHFSSSGEADPERIIFRTGATSQCLAAARLRKGHHVVGFTIGGGATFPLRSCGFTPSFPLESSDLRRF